MKKALLLSFLLFSISLTVCSQTIAQKLPVQQKQETITHCSDGLIWLRGHWQWDTTLETYTWVKGKCMPHKKGHTYIPGRWIKVDNGWKWQDGVWKKI